MNLSTAIDVIESCSGFTESDTPVGEAWATVLSYLHLSQPEPEVVGLSDEELLGLMPKAMRDEFAAVSDVYSTATGGNVKPGLFRVVLNTVALEYARAVLTRYALPVPGAEVG